MGRGRSGFRVLIVAVFAFGCLANANAAPIGKAESVVPATTYVRGSAAHGLAINDPLEQEDVIRTANNGSTRVRFLDDTMLTVGPSAEIRLDKGVFDGSQARTLSVEVIFGAMRFVSGVSSRNSYEIRTPIAAIGVRGTVVDIEHIGTRTIVNFVDGSGPICMIATAECRTISAGGAALAIGPNGFSPATAAEAARMWRRLDGAHLALARQAGRDPSAPSGAAAGTTAPVTASSNNGQGSGNNTGNGNATTGGNLPYVPPPPYNQIVLATNPVTPISDALTYVAIPVSRTYGVANPTFTGTVTGLQNGDVLGNVTTGTLTFGSAATASSNVGTYAINGSGLTVTSQNYSTDILQALGNATALTIVPATLTYTANPASRTYGAANPAFTGTVSGLQNGDALGGVTTGTPTFSSTATASSNVGTYAINGSGLTVTSQNYGTNVLQALGNATALTIVPATLTYTANPVSRTYGAANPAFTGTVSGLQNGDPLGNVTTGTLTFSSTATASSNVGTYPVNGSGLTVTSANYNSGVLEALGNATALTIVPATLTYTADPVSRTYGAANPTFSGTVTGLQNGDLLGNVATGTPAFSSAATASSNVGTYGINGSGLTVTSVNYGTGVLQALGNATALTVVPATLTYTADPVSRAFGVANPTFTGSVTGLKNSDLLGSVTSGTLTFTSPATAASVAGQYPINGSGLTVTSPNYDLTILQDPSNATALTITPAGPAFPSSFTVFRVDGRGGADIPVQLDNQIGDRNGFLYIPASAMTYDPGTNDARSVEISSTPNPANSPTPLTLTRGTAQSHVIVGTAVLPGQGPDPVPAYFLSSWSNGTVDYSAPTIAPGSFSLSANQAFQTVGWGYTGDLFLNPVSFGGNVLFNLENATPAFWSDGHSAPGTFTSGQVAVAVGTTSLHYGMTGTVSMPTIGTFTMSTQGGITNPTQSSAVGVLSGQLARIQSSPGFGTTSPTPNVTYVGSANACPDGCYANMTFDIIAPGKVAVVYAFGDGQNFDNGNNNSNVEVTGIATFAQQAGPPSALSPSAGFVSFTDPYVGVGYTTGAANGTLQVTANGPALQSVHQDIGYIRTQVTAVSADVGSVPGILGWERWTAGTFKNEANQTFTIPTNGGLPFVDGLLATNLPVNSINAPSPGLSVQYSLVGATSPTVTSGSVAPGTLLNTSKIGIDFLDLKVGVDMFVGIGGGSYEMKTTGGASTPSSSSMALSGALFNSGGATVPVTVLTSSGSIGCTIDHNCKATVTGFLAGDGTNNGNNSGGGNPNGQAPPYLGLNYSFGNSSDPLSGFVSGAAAFGRDLPVGNAVGYAFSSTETLHAVGTPTMALGGGPAFAIGDTTASGLSIGQINVSLDNGSSYQSFSRAGGGPPTATVADQGVVSGILSWERWTNGTVNDQVCCNVYSLSSSQGIHVINGVVATDVPTTNITYTYNYVGGTAPTVADGSAAPGSMVGNSKVAVLFGATPAFGVDLNVNIGGGNYNIKSTGGVTTPSLPAPGLVASPVFSNSSILTTLTSGAGLAGCTSTCNAIINGFLAGKGATNLGILYQFNTANAQKMVSGAAAFARP